MRMIVGGYKAISQPVTLNVKPLTLIAGANSSGKSSFVQPFLMMKQTIDAAFDTGPLLLNGPNVRLTRWEQAISRGKSRSAKRPNLQIGVTLGGEHFLNRYRWVSGEGIVLAETEYGVGDDKHRFTPTMSTAQIRENLRDRDLSLLASLKDSDSFKSRSIEMSIGEQFGFLNPNIVLGQDRASVRLAPLYRDYSETFIELLSSMMHVPGLRGNPSRAYASASIGGPFTGTMEKYVASLLDAWQRDDLKSGTKLKQVAGDLEALGLTWKVTAKRLDDVQLELLVGRMPHAQQGGAQDLVNIADVGFGVSQILPVIVSLHAAERGQIVYIEQPEIHLHPRAQAGVANALVAAAVRGVIVIAETHSSLVVRAVQTAVARGDIAPADVSLNWFSRDADTGHTRLSAVQPDRRGRVGDWPVDFDEVAEEVDWKYMLSAGSE